jgi:hypothetical protein
VGERTERESQIHSYNHKLAANIEKEQNKRQQQQEDYYEDENENENENYMPESSDHGREEELEDAEHKQENIDVDVEHYEQHIHVNTDTAEDHNRFTIESDGNVDGNVISDEQVQNALEELSERETSRNDQIYHFVQGPMLSTQNRYHIDISFCNIQTCVHCTRSISIGELRVHKQNQILANASTTGTIITEKYHLICFARVKGDEMFVLIGMESMSTDHMARIDAIKMNLLQRSMHVRNDYFEL